MVKSESFSSGKGGSPPVGFDVNESAVPVRGAAMGTAKPDGPPLPVGLLPGAA
jgi:hypothetical protein